MLERLHQQPWSSLPHWLQGRRCVSWLQTSTKVPMLVGQHLSLSKLCAFLLPTVDVARMTSQLTLSAATMPRVTVATSICDKRACCKPKWSNLLGYDGCSLEKTPPLMRSRSLPTKHSSPARWCQDTAMLCCARQTLGIPAR